MLIAGIDEAGRGPLAGAVFAAAVILDPAQPIEGLRDSKKLSPQRRETLERRIKKHALVWCVASATVEEIDRINILQAALLAMSRACTGLTIQPDRVLVDGNRLPNLPCPGEAVIGGDDCHAQISAASILAKQARDRDMTELARDFPGYGFEQHKGYPTRAHLLALEQLGVTIHHRRSFAPVRRLTQ